jgi:hypothetical protein
LIYVPRNRRKWESCIFKVEIKELLRLNRKHTDANEG